jgi:hypothetical protein
MICCVLAKDNFQSEIPDSGLGKGAFLYGNYLIPTSEDIVPYGNYLIPARNWPVPTWEI